MGADSKIEWTTHTFNPWLGCSKVSAACQHCYAEAWAKRSGLVQWGDNAERRRTSASNWRQPLKWNKEAAAAGERRRVFCASLADVFEDREELREWRYELFCLIDETPNLDWLLLTKRPEDVIRLWPYDWIGPDAERWPNVWIGTTVENQELADKRIPELLKIPARVRFLSCEPLLGPVELPHVALGRCYGCQTCMFAGWHRIAKPQIDWVIVGGESGPNARPMQREWADDLIAQCRAAQVSAFVKQLGAAYSDPANGVAGRSLKVPGEAAPLISRRLAEPKGGDINEFPESLRIRQFPEVAAELVAECLRTDAADYPVVEEMMCRLDPEWFAEKGEGS